MICRGRLTGSILGPSRSRRWLISVLMVALGWGTVTPGAQTLDFTPVGSIPGPFDLVDAADSVGYLARTETLTVFDLTDPTAPVRRGSHAFPEQIWGFTVRDSMAYVAAGHSGLFLLDVSDPDHLVVRGAITTPGQAKNVAVSGPTAVVADHMSGIDVIDVTNPGAPVSLGSVYTDGYARDVAMWGTLAYGVDNPSGFYVLDLTQPDPLQPVGVIQSAPAPRFVEILESAPEVAVLVAGVAYDPFRALRRPGGDDERRGGTLQLYDVSDPATPTPLASFATPGDAQRVTLRGALAYVADGDAGLSVVNLETPTAPRLAGTYRTTKTARDVAVADTTVLVLVGTVRRGAHTQDDGDVVVLQPSR